MNQTISERAPAKVNLALQLTGRRDDGYHLLDSLITFLDLEDTLHVVADNTLALSVEGEFSQGLAGDDNLVLRAARLLQEHAGITSGAAMVLEKNIPVGAGLGGGSADAAAALRALNRLWNCRASDADLHSIAAKLGADVPSCIAGQPARMRGIGDELLPLPSLPECAWILLVYPNVPLATPSVYKSGKAKFTGPLLVLPYEPIDWYDAVRDATNDLYPAAQSLSPEVTTMIESLKQLQGAIAVRMSGSGSACFALFDDERVARMGEQHFAARHPSGVWFRLCKPKSA